MFAHKLYLWVVFLVFLWSSPIKAAEMLITGVYQGQNVYIQNPHDGNKNYCISTIFVNDHKIEPPQTTAFDLDLSFLKNGDTIIIKIIHRDDCHPKIMNMSAIRIREDFQFINIEATEQKIIWVTKGERKFAQFFFEAFKNNVWLVEKVFNCKGIQGNNIYDLPVTHNSGMNKYRIKYLEISGKTSYSPEVIFESDAEKVTFFPKSVAETITFSKSVKYEILDPYYNVLLRGNGASVDCKKLKPGNYYVVFDNRTEKFLKK